jgi:TetR/AcrR family transcriptional regulator, regulator of autoinduction and epiphytic fitness
MDLQPSLPLTGGTSDESPHRRRLPPDERRANLFDAALAVFAELGYDRATLSDVVDRIGVTKGCLYHHFQSKEQLFLALLRDRVAVAVRADEEILGAATGSREQVLRALVERQWTHLQEPGQIELTTLALNELPKIPDAGRDVFDDVVARKRAMMRQVLERENPAADTQPVETELAATIIPWMILGVALGRHVCSGFERSTLSAEQVGEAVTNIILRGVGGVCPEAGVNPAP